MGVNPWCEIACSGSPFPNARPDDKDIAGRITHDAFGNAADLPGLQAGSTVSGYHDQGCSHGFRKIADGAALLFFNQGRKRQLLAAWIILDRFFKLETSIGHDRLWIDTLGVHTRPHHDGKMGHVNNVNLLRIADQRKRSIEGLAGMLGKVPRNNHLVVGVEQWHDVFNFAEYRVLWFLSLLQVACHELSLNISREAAIYLSSRLGASPGRKAI